ncbi:hypothetical protein OTB20_17735 [Streptomyces sp. H27-H1]|uniref:hypothetical protein n=1 Tax=Streptomyces sp. H27-H1 TaxID=2996461 RepID=UPI0022702462|nr:hypothetical protein [Streptomyces sp. H27-H1]MCY0928006.1 hypothetical protein [Streptomyces sp. H27-H1]
MPVLGSRHLTRLEEIFSGCSVVLPSDHRPERVDGHPTLAVGMGLAGFGSVRLVRPISHGPNRDRLVGEGLR